MEHSQLLTSGKIRIAYLSCKFEDDDEGLQNAQYCQILVKLFNDALAGKATIKQTQWDDPNIQWSNYKAILIGPVWDYHERLNEFLGKIKLLADRNIVVFNSPKIVEWNANKIYLQEFDKKGIPIIPTIFDVHLNSESLKKAFFSFGSENTLIIKPQVGANSEGKITIKFDEACPQISGLVMIQPYQKNFDTEGEQKYIFIDGEYSHSIIIKEGVPRQHKPLDNDFQAAWDVLRIARELLGEMPLYARIDMVRDLEENRLLLSEFEVIEPDLYYHEETFPKSKELGNRMAAALLKQLKV